MTSAELAFSAVFSQMLRIEAQYSQSFIHTSKTRCGFLVFSRGACPPMGGTAHQPSRPPMAARFQALPSTHFSGTQEQSGMSTPGRPQRAP
eukprot:scaffold33151_cov108-Isochrysis_galbana.AAC.3